MVYKVFIKKADEPTIDKRIYPEELLQKIAEQNKGFVYEKESKSLFCLIDESELFDDSQDE